MAQPVDELLDQVRLLWHVLVQAAERLHEGEPVTLGMRAVMEFLARNGPTTVPDKERGFDDLYRPLRHASTERYDNGAALNCPWCRDAVQVGNVLGDRRGCLQGPHLGPG